MKTKINNPFYAQKTRITAALQRSTTLDGAARILARELDVPFQITRGVVGQNNRKIKRLCSKH